MLIFVIEIQPIVYQNGKGNLQNLGIIFFFFKKNKTAYLNVRKVLYDELNIKMNLKSLNHGKTAISVLLCTLGKHIPAVPESITAALAGKEP